jgi:hypothetical protein
VAVPVMALSAVLGVWKPPSRWSLLTRCAGDHCTGARYQRNLFPELVSGTGAARFVLEEAVVADGAWSLMVLAAPIK